MMMAQRLAGQRGGVRALATAAKKAGAVRHPVPPFTEETARQKVQAAEDAWNSRDAETVSLAYAEDSVWRNRGVFLRGREEIRKFLEGKWDREEHYSLKKHYFSHTGDRIAVTFQYEFREKESGRWFRAYGNEHWTFDEQGYMKVRNASINDVEITEAERRLQDPADPRLEALSTGVVR